MKGIALGVFAAILLCSFALAQYGGVNVRGNAEVNGNLNGIVNSNNEANVNVNGNLNDREDFEYRETLVTLNADVDSSVSRVSQTYVVNGFGWAVGDNEGMFARVMIAQRAIVGSDGNEYTLAHGVLQLDNNAAYKLTHDSRDQASDEFSVWMNGNWAGTLDIDSKKEYGNLVIWKGNLKLVDQGDYAIEFATNHQWISDDIDGNAMVDTELDATISEGKYKKAGLNGWAKLKSLFNVDNYRLS